MSDIGSCRNFNEDALALPQAMVPTCFPELSSLRGPLFLLADGMGGAPAGSVASNLAVRLVMQGFYRLNGEADIPGELQRIIEQTNQQLFDISETNPELTGMSTTLVAMAFEHDRFFACTVGDSRIYRLRSGQLEQLSEDQSVVWELYRQGEITKDEILTHPRKNILSQSMGTHLGIEVLAIEQETVAGDLYLMCSDGLSDVVPDSIIEQLLLEECSLEQRMQDLLTTARQMNSHDNATVIICQV